jgi:hypothetical protein
VLIAVMNVKFHLFQKLIDLFTVVTVSKKINHKVMSMRNFQELIEGYLAEMTAENQDVMTDENLAEMIEGNLAEMTAESQDVMTDENQVEINLEN